MKLFHGSNIKVEKPRIIDSGRFLDFGIGFCLTTDFEQAKKWAKSTTKRRENGKAVISVFEISENDIDSLSILSFDFASKEWLQFVARNRKSIINDLTYDIIIGPVANDNTMPVITLYLRGAYDEDETIKRLLPQKLKDQVVFKTDKSLEFLRFMEAIEI